MDRRAGVSQPGTGGVSEPSRVRWEHLQRLFHQALELTSGAREVFLSTLDPSLRPDLMALLRAHQDGGPVRELPDHAAEPGGGTVGPFRLERLLGTGGMGAVYLAQRTGTDFTQRVALKLIRAGFADPRLEAHLLHERRVLARLEHPGIARFVDGGTTESGQSWFAMEYVEGVPLTEYCTERRLSVGDRVGLIHQICDALGYAHQQLVVHGDLKPGNILVTEPGRPKLLDFGIAELLDPGRERTAVPGRAPWITPGYASPEQLRGESPGTLADVYALGIILNEVLGESRPGRAQAGDPPDPPSTRVHDPRIRRQISGDLDAIALRASASDPHRRYPSVEAFSEDLRRYLDGRPVEAHPDRLTYRAGKFVRRHRVAVGATGLLTVSLLVGTATVAWQATVANRARARAESALRQSQEVADFLIGLFEEADPLQAPGDTIVARALLRRGLAAVESLDAQPAVQGDLLDALGLILAKLGQFDRALDLVERGLAIRRARYGDTALEVAPSLKHVGRVLRAKAEYIRAESLYRAALAIERAHSGVPHEVIAGTVSDLAFLMPYLGRVAESEAYYREALAMRLRVLEDHHPDVVQNRLYLASALRRRAQYAAAESVAQVTLGSVTRHLGPNHPLVTGPLLALADLFAEDSARWNTAVDHYRRVITIRREHPQSGELALVHPMDNLGDLLGRMGRHREAEALLREVVEIHRRTLGPGQVGGSQVTLAKELLRQGRLTEAESLARVGLNTWQAVVGPDHPAVGGVLGDLADILAARGNLPEALRMAREGLAIRRARLDPLHPLVAVAITHVAGLELRQGNLPEAERLLLEALGIYSDQGLLAHRDTRTTYRLLADLNVALGRADSVAKYRDLAAR
jgi:tetratricopeptide (TPR) repeat protein/predicted Ser/Thr protein kinase